MGAVEPTRVFSPAQRREAEDVAEQIRQGIGSVAPLVERAWQERHWERLGYGDWASYSAAEFGADRVGARRAVAALLSGEGLSARQISEQTGVPRTTVQRDVGHSPQSDVTRAAQTRATGTDQAERNAGVTPDKPKTVAQRVREHRGRQRGQQGSACDHSAGLMLVCRSCRQPDKAAGSSFDAIEARHRQELAGLRSEVERLQDENAELRRSVPPGGPVQAGPGTGTRTPGNTADPSLGELETASGEYADPVPDDLGEESQDPHGDDVDAWLAGFSDQPARGRRR